MCLNAKNFSPTLKTQ